MRILQILEATIGGTARHGVDLCAGLRAAGHEVHLIYNPRENRMDAIFRAGLPRLTQAGVILVPMDMDRSVRPSDVRVIRAIRSYIRRQGPFDVIHGHSSKGGAYARVAPLGFRGSRVYTPNAFVTTSPDLGPASSLFYSLAERLLAPLGHGLIAVSLEERDEAKSLGISPDTIFVVPNGTDVRAAVPGLTRRQLGLPEDVLLIGSVARFVPQKAPRMLVRAFARLAERVPNVHLAMVGIGPLFDSCVGEAKRLGIENRIHWPGLHDGPSVMHLFDVYALPSAFEGFPYVLIEAMSNGVPVVTTDVGGASMLVEPGFNGFIVPQGRPDEFALAMERLVRDHELRRKMAVSARERATSFGAARMVAGNVEVYETLMRRSRDRA